MAGLIAAKIGVSSEPATITMPGVRTSGPDPLFAVIVGDNGFNDLEGTTGDDTIDGLGGSDTLAGLDGADVLNGGNGDDLLFGSYASSSVPPPGTTDVGDTLSGGNGADVLRGSDGDDRLLGGAGVDNLRGDLGSDYMNGGEGEDFAAYRFDDIGVTAGVNLDFTAIGSAETVVVGDGQGGFDTLVSIERGVITGSSFADTITGGSIIEQLASAGGDDLIDAGGGDDRVLDNEGNSTLSGGAGDDLVLISDLRWRSAVVEGGDDIVDGGAGTDILQLDWYNLATTIRSNAVGTGGFHIFTTDGAFDVVASNIEALSIAGGSGNDRIDGGRGADIVYGYGGGDSIRGGNGNDVVYGGDGADTLAGGAGVDRYAIVFEDANRFTDHQVNYLDFDTSGATQTINDLMGSTDRITAFEGVAIYGVYGDDVLVGSLGDDIIDGGFGFDTLDGDDGNDVFQMWSSFSFSEYNPDTETFEDVFDGDDTVYGGSGLDTLDYSPVEHDLTISLFDGQASSEGTGIDFLNSIERVIGGRGNDAIAGTDLNETLDGGGGDDFLSGEGGKDRLIGGLGADQLFGGAGQDVFFYNSVEESTAADSDLIIALASNDRINLSTIDADVNTAGNQAFVLAASFTGVAGQLVRSYDAENAETTFSGDVDGDGVADLVITVEDDASGFTGFVL